MAMWRRKDAARVILGQLNAYGDRDFGSGPCELNIWQDVIVGLPAYDEAATDRIDRGKNDRFVALDTVFFYGHQHDRWHMEPYSSGAWDVRPAHLWPCGCLVNDADAHRKGCPVYPEGKPG